ncbi:MAG: serine/threonine-protein kinase [Myxococcota bacterium]|nr:serine/threonine-protein kinase [Myxococcota bacterium]
MDETTHTDDCPPTIQADDAKRRFETTITAWLASDENGHRDQRGILPPPPQIQYTPVQPSFQPGQAAAPVDPPIKDVEWTASIDARGTPTTELRRTLGTRVFGDHGTDASSAGSRFQILKHLGEGAAGQVFLAFDTDIGREVAIKFYRGSVTAPRDDVAREARITGRVAHSGAVPLYDVGRGDDGAYYCIMKHLSGYTLGEVIDRLKAGDAAMHLRFSFTQRATLMLQLLRTLVATHRSGIIHRDIKPNNILIGPTGELTLIDWSIAIDQNEGGGAGPISGTPAYMAPEQARGESVDARTDVYGVGATLYELLSLRKAAPKYGASMPAYLKQLSDYTPEPVDTIPNAHQGFVPSEYRNLLRRALARDPSERYPSALDMLEDLQTILDGRFNAVCPRTHIKSRLHSLMRWLDVAPHRNVRMLWGAMLVGMVGLFGLGLALGSLLLR